MVDTPQITSESLSVSSLLAIDKICRQFEAELKAGNKPQIDAYLGDMPDPQRGELQRELESIQREYGQKSGHHATLAQFVQNLVASGLMSEQQVQTVLDELPADQQPQTAEDLAKLLHRSGRLTRFQTQAVYQGKTRGLVLGNYVVLDKLGRGGMGQVFKAQHRRMERVVALKMLPAAMMRSSEAIKRFQREAKAAAKLSHSNVVTAYDADEAGGVHFLVMEYVEGQDLESLVKERGPLNAATAVDYVLQAARGLEYAHRHGVVHRDIKPSNLLVDGEGTVKVLDMGLARVENAKSEGEALTHSGQVMGTLDFMSPEQALDTRHVDGRTDIYSLGCTLYYLLTGQPPYGGDTMTKKILIHREDPIPSLRAACPHVPEALESTFQKMLAKTPAERQSSMAEVITQLGNCVPTAGHASPPPPPRARTPSAETLSVTADGLADTSKGEASEISLKRSVVTPQEARDARSARVSDPADPADRRSPAIPETSEAIGRLARQDYAGVIELLGAVPPEQRSAEADQVLKQAQELQAEANELNKRMQRAVRDRQYQGLRENVLERLLELEPGNLTARDIYEHLGTYGPGDRLRFDKDGTLLPAHSQHWWVDRLARLMYERMTRRRVTHGKPRPRRPGEPATESGMGSDVPLIPLAIGWGVLGVVGLLLGIVFLLRDGDQTVRVELDPALVRDATVTVWLDGNQMEIAGLGETIRLKPGEHGYEIRRGDEIIAAREFRVLKGDNPALRISVEGKAAATAQAEPTAPPVTVDQARSQAGAAGKAVSGTVSDASLRVDAAKESRTRWLGYTVREQPVTSVYQIVSHANFVIDYGWPSYGDQLMNAARGARLKVVVAFAYEHEYRAFETSGIGMVRKNRDVSSAVCWINPYAIEKKRPSDLSEFGRNLKESVPGIEFWAMFTPDELEQHPVPDEVDVLLIDFIGATSPDVVQSRANEVVPSFVRSAKGRPVVLHWTNWDRNPPGVVAKCQPGTMAKCAEIVERYGLAGLEFADYGSETGYVGLQTRPDLVAEVKQIAKDWGVQKAESALGLSPQEAAEGFVSLFDGKTLDGWHGDPDRWRVADGAIVGEAPPGVHTFLSLQKPYQDFVLKAKFMLAYGNSGIQIRSRQLDGYKMSGPQIDILSDTEFLGLTYIEGDKGPVIAKPDLQRAAQAYRPDDWNEYVITCRGSRITVELNGHQTLDFDDRNGQVDRTGMIGFQLFSLTRATSVSFKGIHVRQLKPSEEEQRGPPAAIAPFDTAQAKQYQQAWSEYLDVGMETTNSIGMTLVLIPPGEFEMGSSAEEVNVLCAQGKAQNMPETFLQRIGGEIPRHAVKITRPFHLAKYETTVAQFNSFVQATRYQTDAEKDGQGSYGFGASTRQWDTSVDYSWRHHGFPQSDDEPVILASWNDAVAFCVWLTAKEGKTYRLPTEAEWEYSCRAGTTGYGSWGSREDDLRRVANVADASLKREWPEAPLAEPWDDGFPFTAPVGRFQANAFGLYDTHGNVWEWCADWYGEDYFRQSPREDPSGPSSGDKRVIRGGAWNWGHPDLFRSSVRHCWPPDGRHAGVGLRVVCEIGPADKPDTRK